MTKIIITIDGKNAGVKVEEDVKLVDLLRATIELEERVKTMLDSSTIKEEDISETLEALLELMNYAKVRNTEDGDTSRPSVYPSFFEGHEFSKKEGR